MSMKLIGLAAGLWLVFLILAIICAGFRESVLSPRLGDLIARNIGTFILMLLVGIVTYSVLSRTSLEYDSSDLIAIGVFWMISTIIFEFVFGHYVMGRSFSYLIADYNVLKGRPWSIFLIFIAIHPYLLMRFL